jgi:uncharacterized protein (TIGR02996 family)
MNERQRLVRAAAEQPGDDAPRLVLADWLEEHGEAGRGTFIRTGVELARMDEADDAYPETLARHLRSASFAVEPREPWFDCIPGGSAWFRRGMLAGAVLGAEEYLAPKKAHWLGVPLEELVLFAPEDVAAAPKLARREELARLRLLGLDCWSCEAARPLLCGCKHLAGLREMFAGNGLREVEGTPGLTLEQFADAIDLPALEAFCWRRGDPLAWPALVPRFGGQVSRLVLESGSDPDLDDHADCWGWLVRTPLWRRLRRANVWHNINTISYSTVYQTDPMPDFGRNFAAAPLEDYHLAVADIPHLGALRSWGALHTLRIAHTALDDLLAPVAETPKARQLRRLFLDHPDGPYAEEGQPAPDVLSGPNLAGLRHLRLYSYDFVEGELAGLRGGAYRENLLRLELGEYGPRLPAAEVRELLARPWPRLRHLRIGLDSADGLAALVESRSLPSLCTLTVVGSPDLGEAAVTSLARAQGLPHLSLFVLGDREWLLDAGEARPVADGVWLREREALYDGPYRR